MRISNWSSDVCCSDLYAGKDERLSRRDHHAVEGDRGCTRAGHDPGGYGGAHCRSGAESPRGRPGWRPAGPAESGGRCSGIASRSEEHTSELPSLMRSSYAVFCLKKKNQTTTRINQTSTTNLETNKQYSE